MWWKSRKKSQTIYWYWNFVMISILFTGECGKIIYYTGGFWASWENIHKAKALLPDILSESDHLLVYTEFQSNVAFYCIKTPQKQAVATLKNSKTNASSLVTQILHTPTHRGIHPNGITLATTHWVVAFQQYDRNTGQITLNKHIRTHTW